MVGDGSSGCLDRSLAYIPQLFDKAQELRARGRQLAGILPMAGFHREGLKLKQICCQCNPRQSSWFGQIMPSRQTSITQQLQALRIFFTACRAVKPLVSGLVQAVPK